MVTFPGKARAAGPSFNLITASEYLNITKELSANFIYTTVMPASNAAKFNYVEDENSATILTAVLASRSASNAKPPPSPARIPPAALIMFF